VIKVDEEAYPSTSESSKYLWRQSDMYRPSRTE
jgi:hypothetical protein